ncbi:BZ3500_MvSof-1268-A1-R1_Chr1-3g02470 [Microbotryum saponariae]|uniref:BZ3500_MvSof-1268-A1-R1_Chr1-3g02470 protein n=1 Tax=Microbotryum saponariae TaxID=289078 RepID=A0A2X0KEY8_9BASI|nr:BZ3500_MvSof-1268-A1-R1_Chr1-3g02470 [Microbotryum saponariae]SCZ96323.1 BZ3501_MvSof-1269-A2-R1_Chr1-3g02073 [Microbotryum saponariae]
MKTRRNTSSHRLSRTGALQARSATGRRSVSPGAGVGRFRETSIAPTIFESGDEEDEVSDGENAQGGTFTTAVTKKDLQSRGLLCTDYMIAIAIDESRRRRVGTVVVFPPICLLLWEGVLLHCTCTKGPVSIIEVERTAPTPINIAPFRRERTYLSVRFI